MQITQIPPANPGNDKGKRTFQFQFPDGRQFTYCTRHKGEIVGSHFHKGDDPSKNPEFTLLLSGEIECRTISIGGSVGITDVSAANGPVLIEIEPWLGHTFLCRTDCILGEYRKTWFDPTKSDCYPLSDMAKATQPA